MNFALIRNQMNQCRLLKQAYDSLLVTDSGFLWPREDHGVIRSKQKMLECSIMSCLNKGTG
jgi:hypothetical protein